MKFIHFFSKKYNNYHIINSLYPSCLLCGNFTFGGICNFCLKGLEELAKPQMDKNLKLIYFFKYEDIEDIIKSKYLPFGNKILEKVASITFGKIFQNPFPFPVTAIPIDPFPYRGFSHTAILAKYLPFPITYGLYLKNRVQYSGKDMAFRLTNLREFIYKGPCNIKGILIDDVVTTGLTIKVATQFLEQFNIDIIATFSLAKH